MLWLRAAAWTAVGAASGQLLSKAGSVWADETHFRNAFFEPIVLAVSGGHGRTTGAIPKGKMYRRLAGQAFWEELTGDADFYLKLMRLMGEYPVEHRIEYETEFNALVSRFNTEFKSEFSASDGSINWEKLIAFNSSREKPKNSKLAREVADDEYQPSLL